MLTFESLSHHQINGLRLLGIFRHFAGLRRTNLSETAGRGFYYWVHMRL